MEVYLGIDIGSVSTKFVVLDRDNELVAGLYLPTEGKPVAVLQEGLRQVKGLLPAGAAICGVATTGSGRRLGGVIVGADLVKNEITCQAVAALHYLPSVQTVLEIGGQDSKIIIIRDGVVTDFGMNTVCAAGTGSFLDHQALRLHISIAEMGERALQSDTPARIAGRCTVFAESDMVHRQQTGYHVEDVIYGLCQALARNYLNGVAAGRDIQPPVLFQGGVAFNRGMLRAFREALGVEVIVPAHHEVTGAIGAALLVHEELAGRGCGSCFRGFGISEADYRTSSFECRACPASCEVARVSAGGKVLASWGGRCQMWEGEGNLSQEVGTYDNRR